MDSDPVEEAAVVPAAAGIEMLCTSCGEIAPEGSTWCEACGHELAVEATMACVQCGEREVAPEGYCLSCGARQPDERDHLVVADGAVVAVSDRGRRHHDNEDSVAVGVVEPMPGVPSASQPSGSVESSASEDERPVVLVVCDGVSSTPDSAKASAAAAGAARDVLVEAIATARAAGTVIEVSEVLQKAVDRAQAKASAAAEQGQPDHAGGPPSSTLVAVIATPSADGVHLATAWVGDSRAYWVGVDETRRLTGDDHELGGSLVRWLGADSLDPSPDIDQVTIEGPGHLVVCSDGLWRYAAEPAQMGSLIETVSSEATTAVELADGLVGFANESGGHDNITVAVWSNHAGWPERAGGQAAEPPDGVDDADPPELSPE